MNVKNIHMIIASSVLRHALNVLRHVAISLDICVDPKLFSINNIEQILNKLKKGFLIMEIKDDYIYLIATVYILAFSAFSRNNEEKSLDNINNNDTEAKHLTVNESNAHQNEQTQPVSIEVPREPKPAVNPT